MAIIQFGGNLLLRFWGFFFKKPPLLLLFHHFVFPSSSESSLFQTLERESEFPESFNPISSLPHSSLFFFIWLRIPILFTKKMASKKSRTRKEQTGQFSELWIKNVRVQETISHPYQRGTKILPLWLSSPTQVWQGYHFGDGCRWRRG